MSDLLLAPTALLYVLFLLILLVYSANALYLALLAWRRRSADPAPPPLDEIPLVTVQIPLYNELYVAERVIDAVARFDWPLESLQIQVLDDSTDETQRIVGAAVERWRARGVDIQVIRRTGREGFKAGALAAGLAAARGDYIAYFDADFEPPADFLRRTIPHFADPRIAFVQARWGHLNHRYSVLTLLQSLLLDAHFMIEQFARSRGGYAFNFNGTAGVWRRVAIEAAGGWRFDTLTEDIDLSYRAFIGGWKAMYLRDLVCPAELPVTMTGFLRQQHRWAQGGLECSLKLLPQIWKARFGWGSKVQATYHLTGLYLHFAMFALILAYPVIILVSQRFPELTRLYGLGALWSVPSAVWPLFLALAQQQMGERWMRRVPAIAVTGALGSTMMLVTLRAAWRLVRGGQRVFERTPKFGIARPQDSWSGRRYHLPFASPLLLEILVALWALATTVYALSTRAWVLAVLPGFLFVGALLVVVLTLKQSTTAGAAPRPTASA